MATECVEIKLKLTGDSNGTMYALFSCWIKSCNEEEDVITPAIHFHFFGNNVISI